MQNYKQFHELPSSVYIVYIIYIIYTHIQIYKYNMTSIQYVKKAENLFSNHKFLVCNFWEGENNKKNIKGNDNL